MYKEILEKAKNLHVEFHSAFFASTNVIGYEYFVNVLFLSHHHLTFQWQIGNVQNISKVLIIWGVNRLFSSFEFYSYFMSSFRVTWARGARTLAHRQHVQPNSVVHCYFGCCLFSHQVSLAKYNNLFSQKICKQLKSGKKPARNYICWSTKKIFYRILFSFRILASL